MMIFQEQYTVSNEPEFYEAWPDVAMAKNGNLVCVFSECLGHCNRSYSRIVCKISSDGGRTWGEKHPVTEETSHRGYYYNCARITCMKDGRLVITLDKIHSSCQSQEDFALSQVMICFSEDNGETWGPLLLTPLEGLVPDKLCVLETGRWLLSAHRRQNGYLAEFLRYSDNEGADWSNEIEMASEPGYNLCESCLLPLNETTIVALLRENSFLGLDCRKVVSLDCGEHWSKPVPFSLPGCHRPTLGQLSNGQIFITYRFAHGALLEPGLWTQNLFGALTTANALLEEDRRKMGCRIFPIDYDRAVNADTGYSGWVELPDTSVCVVNYIVDDAIDTSQIRAYILHPSSLILQQPCKEEVRNSETEQEHS